MDSRECLGVLIVCIGIGKYCPKSLHGQFKRKDHKYPTLILEAVADQRLDAKTFKFKTVQEAARKYIERAFGFLQEPNMVRSWVERCDLHVRKAKELRDRKTHIDLRQDLVEHLWKE
ncbi:RNA-directed DNA polymerase, eukaryota [Tanacetum coccineum]